jgi:phosphoadenylyl-sulfate reductase (thioredoxin)
MVLIDLAVRLDPRVRVFTIDTGRLPEETHRMIETVRERYGISTEIVQPEPAEVLYLIAPRGPDLFYESVDARRRCCDVRKVRPLERKLATLSAWATGIRREQAETRAHTPKVDRSTAPLKLSPLADWTGAQVEEYTRQHRLPVHPLYARGYASIGCEPCTRAISAGEDARAGRWWWEDGAYKECGIHFSPDGKVRRAS